MDREEFLKKMAHDNPKVSVTEKELVSGMEMIKNYFSEIYNEYSKQNLDPQLFSVGSNGFLTVVGATYKNTDLNFDRKDDNISVRLSTNKFLTPDSIQELDTLKLHNNGLVSKKFDLPLSEKLLDKYLEFLMK